MAYWNRRLRMKKKGTGLMGSLDQRLRLGIVDNPNWSSEEILAKRRKAVQKLHTCQQKAFEERQLHLRGREKRRGSGRELMIAEGCKQIRKIE